MNHTAEDSENEDNAENTLAVLQAAECQMAEWMKLVAWDDLEYFSARAISLAIRRQARFVTAGSLRPSDAPLCHPIEQNCGRK